MRVLLPALLMAFPALASAGVDGIPSGVYEGTGGKGPCVVRARENGAPGSYGIWLQHGARAMDEGDFQGSWYSFDYTHDCSGPESELECGTGKGLLGFVLRDNPPSIDRVEVWTPRGFFSRRYRGESIGCADLKRVYRYEVSSTELAGEVFPDEESAKQAVAKLAGAYCVWGGKRTTAETDFDCSTGGGRDGVECHAVYACHVR